MQFVTYNIQYGLGEDGRYDLDRIAAAVEDADVIALQEVAAVRQSRLAEFMKALRVCR